MKVNELNLSDLFADCEKVYNVPLYQREYAWTETEIAKMLTDLWEAFDKAPQRNYYFGTLVVCPELDGHSLQVIDGQQRLTTFMLLSVMLKPDITRFNLHFANRDKVNEFISKYLEYGGDLNKIECKPESFVAAVGCLRAFRPSLDDGSLYEKSLGTGLLEEKRNDVSFKDFILQQVKLFEVVMPSDTDAMAYFEVMNNRGEQLQYHELLKAELLGKLFQYCQATFGEDASEKYSDLSMRFNKFWTACSKMDGHLIDHMHACIELKDDSSKWQNVELEKYKCENDESGVPQERQSVIRDFANFLMHVLRIYVKTYGANVQESDIPLDERLMQKWYETVNVDPMKFINVLIKVRLAFDQYVVKAKMSDGEVEGWRLKEIVRYSQKGMKSGSYKAKNTFGEDGDAAQAKLIMLESALQVSNADQRHKEWLYTILSADGGVRSDPALLISMLHQFLAKRINEAKSRAQEHHKPFYCQGLMTPRLVLNTIDYLMWLKSLGADENATDVLHVPRESTFKYLNSVEHHHPQHDNQVLEQWSPSEMIDDIGNLFLVYSSENSSMNNREPHEKKRRYSATHNGNLPDNPKRHWMYEHTFDDGRGWQLEDMQRLSRYVQKLMEDFLSQNTPVAQ